MLRKRGQWSRSNDYEKVMIASYVASMLLLWLREKCAAAAASMGLHVNTTARLHMFLVISAK